MEPMIVAPGERGIVRVFALDLPPEQARFLHEEPSAIDQLVGMTPLLSAHAEVIRISDLEGLGLVGYLIEGCGVSRAEIGADESTLDALEGWVLILRSRAFDGQSGTLAPEPGLRFVGAYREAVSDWTAPKPLTADSAQPYSGTRTPPRQARAEARRIGFTWFAVVMALIIGGVLWLVLA